jgi:hypothetical protein
MSNRTGSVRLGVRRYLHTVLPILMIIATVWAGLPLRAQVNTGRISGAITDQTGGAIAGVMVTVTDVARGESRPLIADAAGQYAAPI